MSIEGQGHFFTIYFQVLFILFLSRPRYQVSVTIGPLVVTSVVATTTIIGVVTAIVAVTIAGH